MSISEVAVSCASYRNFSLCPHCEVTGQPATLCRLCEGLPMISRSDGTTFHLLLADQPLPYPMERSSGKTRNLSLCFWYMHAGQPKQTLSTIVLLRDADKKRHSLFRKIEVVADLLSEELSRCGKLANVYELDEQHGGFQPS